MERNSLVVVKNRTEYKQKYSVDNKDRLNTQTRQWHKNNPERSLFITARARAKLKKLPFTIETEDIKIPDICPVLGIPLFVSLNKRTDNTPSLDKQIPSEGYTKNNIAIISWRANRLKSDATLDELKLIVKYLENSS